MSILQEFDDVFPQELPPGLPPLRGIEHRIDLIPGAPLPNRAAYRTNPEETKEIEKQIRDLLDKGYVRESLSPCAVPVILVPKQDSSLRVAGSPRGWPDVQGFPMDSRGIRGERRRKAVAEADRKSVV